MTLEEAKITIYANCIYACEKAGFGLSTICMVDDALRTVIAIADRKTEDNSEKPNNCEWSVEYAKEMLDTMSCEECGHWEHGAGDHYYCALLEMRQECCFESKGESTFMFANKPKDEPTISKMEQVDKDINVRSKDEPKPCEWCKFYDGENCFSQEPCKVMLYFKTEPQTDCQWK